MLSEAPPARIGAVEGLRTLSGELRAIPLRWDPLLAGDVGGYAVERATAADGPYQRIAIVMGRFQTATTDRGADLGAKLNARETAGDLGDGNTYYYRVRPFDSRGHLGAQVAPLAVRHHRRAPRPADGLPRLQPAPAPGRALLRAVGRPDRGRLRDLAQPERERNLPAGREARRALRHHLGRPRASATCACSTTACRRRTPRAARAIPTAAARAVTKPEPLPPVGVHLAERSLGRNVVAWERNVERDLAGYRVLRRRENAERDELVAEVSAETFRVSDDAVGASEKLAYLVLAFDRDGLESETSEPVEDESVGYGLSAEVEGDTVTLRWDEQVQQELASVRVLVGGAFGEAELARAGLRQLRPPRRRAPAARSTTASSACAPTGTWRRPRRCSRSRFRTRCRSPAQEAAGTRTRAAPRRDWSGHLAASRRASRLPRSAPR